MEKGKKILKGAVLLAVFLWILSVLPFSSNIEREIPAAIYKDGVLVETTSVSISGKKTNYLFRKDSFEGRFYIHSIEKTGGEEAWAFIQWDNKEQNIQRIFYVSPGLIHHDIVNSVMIINPEMTQFAVALKDGSVLAASQEVYDIYAAQIEYDPERESTSIYGKIPAF